MEQPRKRGIDKASLLGFCLFAVALIFLHRSLRHYTWSEIAHNLRATSSPILWMAGLFAFLNYVALIFYEFFAFECLGRAFYRIRIATASFVVNAFGHTIGFPALTGAALRYRFYTRWGLSGWESAKITVLTYLPATLGFLTMCGACFVIAPVELPSSVPLPSHSLRATGALMLLFPVAFVAASFLKRRQVRWRQFEMPIPTPAIALAQVLTGGVKWCVSGIMIYDLIRGWHFITPGAFASYYCLAQVAAILTHSPGGLGVFDGVLLASLRGHVSPPAMAGALLLYRLFYNVIPLLLSVPIYFYFEWSHRPIQPQPQKAAQ